MLAGFLLIFGLESRPLRPKPRGPDYLGCMCTDHRNTCLHIPQPQCPRLLPHTHSAPLSTHHTDQTARLFTCPSSLTSLQIQLTESQRIFHVCQCHSKNSLTLLVKPEPWSFVCGDFKHKFNTNLKGSPLHHWPPPKGAEDGHEPSRFTDKLTYFLLNLRNLTYIRFFCLLRWPWNPWWEWDDIWQCGSHPRNGSHRRYPQRTTYLYLNHEVLTTQISTCKSNPIFQVL